MKARQMASVGHIYGRPIIGAEAFTSGQDEQWKRHPATIEALGDYEFSEGINRFVIHRYAHQPYLDRAPGATMGPWGLHYERTETWWDLSSSWHEYLSRCQFMLRQGKFVADLCYLRPELPMQTYFTPRPAVPDGYKYDECSAEALIARTSVQNGRLVLPDSMTYRLLVLPPVKAMTIALALKLNQLVEAGATILVNGPRPQTSPGLAGFPESDKKVAELTAKIWGDCDGRTVTEHALGKGRLIWGQPIANVLAALETPTDFLSDMKLNWIHRHADGAEIYFVANQSAASIEAECYFRIKDLQPELWNPVTGSITPLGAYKLDAGGTSIPLHFDPSGSVFVIFRKRPRALDPVVDFTRDGKSVFVSAKATPARIQKATYGVPGDPRRTRDVRARLQALVDEGVTDFQVGDMAEGDDPAYGIVKTLVVEYVLDGRTGSVSGRDPERVSIPLGAGSDRDAEVRLDAGGRLSIEARQAGRYELRTTSGKLLRAEITNARAPVEIRGAWQISFPPKWGAPDRVTIDRLMSWTDSANTGVKFFSGIATYTKAFEWDETGKLPAGGEGRARWKRAIPGITAGRAEAWLDLGDVQVMAQVKLNGHDLGILWKPPFRVNVTGALKRGANTVEIRVASLWPNRMIGDAGLPEKSRVSWSSWQPFTKDTPLLKSGLLGPVTIQTVPIVALR
jgi:hypothetical protein